MFEPQKPKFVTLAPPPLLHSHPPKALTWRTACTSLRKKVKHPESTKSRERSTCCQFVAWLRVCVSIVWSGAQAQPEGGPLPTSPKDAGCVPKSGAITAARLNRACKRTDCQGR